MRIELPWPPSGLRPNAINRQHHFANRGLAKAYREKCLWSIKAAGIGKLDGTKRAHLTMRFCPPDKRRRDLDGMLGQAKHAIDAISEHIGVDDYWFSYTILRGEPVKYGIIEVTITEE